MTEYIESFDLYKTDRVGKEFKVLLNLKNIPQGKDLLIENNQGSCSFSFPTGDANCRFVVDFSSTAPCTGQTTDKEYTFSLGTPYNGDYNNAKCTIIVDGEDENDVLLKNAIDL